MIARLLGSWPALVTLLLFGIVLIPVSQTEWYAQLTSDYKGIGPIFLHLPVAVALVCLVESFRSGFCALRPPVAALAAVIVWWIVMEMGGTGLLFWLGYLLIGFIGEAIGTALARVLRRPETAD